MRATLTALSLLTALIAPVHHAPAQRATLRPEPLATGTSDRGVRRFSLESAILGERRRIDLVLPPSYALTAADRRYPVLILLDGEHLMSVVAPVVAELANRGQIPELVVVAVHNTNRLRDLTPPGLSVSGSSLREGGDRFLDFIERELLPALDEVHRTAAPRVLVGHSSGGILATWAAATRTTFRAVVSLDGPTHLGDRWLVKRLLERAASSPSPLRYVAYGARFPWPEDAWTALVAAAPADWRLHHEALRGESHESMPMLGTYLGLREIFADYSTLAAPVAPTTSILPYYARVDSALGAPVPPPQRLMRNVVEDLLIEGRGAEARRAFDRLGSAYGRGDDDARTLAQIAEVERRPPPTETVEGLLATPFPTPDQARPFVGEWVGDSWMHEDEPRTGRATLRIRIEDGRVVGETIERPEPGVELVRRWEYMRVTPNGLTFGYMNGMRPRAVNLHEGTLRGNELVGTMRFGGVDFRLPDGRTPPPIHFSFRRE